MKRLQIRWGRNLTLSLLVLILLICTIMTNRQAEENDFDPVALLKTTGEYRIIEEERSPEERITDFIVEDGRIFLFYEGIGLTNVFDSEGEFLYGIQVPIREKGQGKIAFDDGKIYVESRDHVVYVFEGSKLILKLDHSSINVPEETETRYRELKEVFKREPCTEWRGLSYRISSDQSKVIATDSQGTERIIIELPAIKTMGKTFGYLTFLVLAALVVFWKPKSYEGTEFPPRRLSDRT